MNMSLRRWLASCCAVFACLASANATVVQGHFQGTAYDSRIDALSPTPRNFDGEVVTGTFRFDTTGLYPPEVNGPDYYFGFVAPGSLQLVFNTQGRTVAFGGDESGDAVTTEIGPFGPIVSLFPGYTYFYYFAGLILASPQVDGLGPATLRPGAFDLENSFAYFFAGRDFGASVQLTELVFETNQIPEPGSAWLMLLGLASLVLALSRGRAGTPSAR